MRKMDGKVKMFGLYAVICAGMLLFTGCTGTNMSDMGTENGAAEKEAANYQDSDSAAHSGTSAGVEKISEGNSEEASAEISEKTLAETSEKTSEKICSPCRMILKLRNVRREMNLSNDFALQTEIFRL